MRPSTVPSEGMSREELQRQLRSLLDRKGVLAKAKAMVRKEIFVGMGAVDVPDPTGLTTHTTSGKRRPAASPAGGAIKDAQQLLVSDILVEEYLRRTGRESTWSVFCAEADVNGDDVALAVPAASGLNPALAVLVEEESRHRGAHMGSEGGGGGGAQPVTTSGGPPTVESSSVVASRDDPVHTSAPLLVRLLFPSESLLSAVAAKTCAAARSRNHSDGDVAAPRPPRRLTLEEKLQAVDAEVRQRQAASAARDQLQPQHRLSSSTMGPADGGGVEGWPETAARHERSLKLIAEAEARERLQRWKDTELAAAVAAQTEKTQRVVARRLDELQSLERRLRAQAQTDGLKAEQLRCELDARLRTARQVEAAAQDHAARLQAAHEASLHEVRLLREQNHELRSECSRLQHAYRQQTYHTVVGGSGGDVLTATAAPLPAPVAEERAATTAGMPDAVGRPAALVPAVVSADDHDPIQRLQAENAALRSNAVAAQQKQQRQPAREVRDQAEVRPKKQRTGAQKSTAAVPPLVLPSHKEPSTRRTGSGGHPPSSDQDSVLHSDGGLSQGNTGNRRYHTPPSSFSSASSVPPSSTSSKSRRRGGVDRLGESVDEETASPLVVVRSDTAVEATERHKQHQQQDEERRRDEEELQQKEAAAAVAKEQLRRQQEDEQEATRRHQQELQAKEKKAREEEEEKKREEQLRKAAHEKVMQQLTELLQSAERTYHGLATERDDAFARIGGMALAEKRQLLRQEASIATEHGEDAHDAQAAASSQPAFQINDFSDSDKSSVGLFGSASDESF